MSINETTPKNQDLLNNFPEYATNPDCQQERQTAKEGWAVFSGSELKLKPKNTTMSLCHVPKQQTHSCLPSCDTRGSRHSCVTCLSWSLLTGEAKERHLTQALTPASASLFQFGTWTTLTAVTRCWGQCPTCCSNPNPNHFSIKKAPPRVKWSY